MKYMKRYNNLAFKTVILFPICSIVYLIFMILGCIYYDGQLIDLVIMCISLIVVIVIIWALLIYMKDVFIITYYDEEKIYQRNLWKKKTLQYNSIKEIYIFGDYIYLTSKVYDLNYSGKEKFLGRKLLKALKNEIVIMISGDAQFLKYISFEDKGVRIYKNRLTHMLSKYSITE